MRTHFRQFEKEKEHAFKVQWEKAEAIKEQAVEGATGSLWKKIKDEYALDKEKGHCRSFNFGEGKHNFFNVNRYIKLVYKKP